jgi:surface protein
MAIDTTKVKAQILRWKNNIASAYTEAENKGATMPTVRNSDNLPATIASITGGGGGGAEITGADEIDVIAQANINKGDTVRVTAGTTGIYVETTPTTLPASSAYRCAFNHNGTRLAVTHNSSPYITIYDTTTTPYTKLSNPTTLPAGDGRGCAFNHDGTRLAVAHGKSPYITIYDTTTTPYTKLSNPTTLPASTGYGCAFNHDGTRLAVAHSSSPYITIYDTTTTPYTKLSDPTTLPAYYGLGCAFNHNGTRLAVAHYTSPYITAYGVFYGTPLAYKANNLLSGLADRYGYAKENISLSAIGKVDVLFAPEPEEWQPRSDWYDVRAIVDADTEEYNGKVGVLYRRVDNYNTTLIPVSTVGAVKARTSDGYTYTTDTQHTWDTTQDKPDNESSNYYVIYYFGGTSINQLDVYKLTQQSRNDILWVYFGGNNYSYDSISVSDTSWRNHYSIEAITKNDNVSVGGGMTSTYNMFYQCYKLQTIPQLDTSAVTNMKYMFYDCYNLTTIPQLDTSKVTNMDNMFYECHSLITIPQLDTSKVTNMGTMFRGCNNLTTIPQLDTSKVTNMNYMFRGCYSLRNIPQLNTSKVTNMNGMFYECYSLTTISQLNTSAVIYMNSMFYECYSLRNINAQLDLSLITNLFNPSIPSYNENVEVSVSFVANTINCNVSFNPNLTVDSLLSLIAGLVDLTGQDAKTLSIGSQNIAKLTNAQKNAITAKNWTYS